MDMRLAGNKSKIPKLYEQLVGKRSPFLSRAENYSRFTLPYLMADVNDDISSQNAWQDDGASATNFLSNKLSQVLFPAQRSFFRIDLTPEGISQLDQEGMTTSTAQKLLSDVEKAAMLYGEGLQFRPAVVEAFKHLIVTGNVMMYHPDKTSPIQAVPLHHYCVRRDNNGTILDVVFLQEKALETFEPSIRMAIQASRKGKQYKDKDNVKLYTHAKRTKDGKYSIRQSADDTPVGKESIVTEDKSPFLILTWKRSYGEDYGRGMAEDHAGAFFVIQFLSEALARGMALMADVKYLVKPGSYTDINQFVEGGSGAVLHGVEGDIHIVQLGKYADYTPIQAVLNDYRQRIGRVFMMESMTRRDAERVTAYEIQRDAMLVEQSLGGVYSLFATTFQGPLARWFMNGISSILSTKKVSPTILTGIEALGRMAELDKLGTFNGYVSMTAQWPENLQQAIKWPEFTDWVQGQISANFPFFKTSEELQAEAEAQQQQQATQFAAEQAGKAIPDMVKNGQITNPQGG